MVEEVQREVCAVTVGNGCHPFERIAETVFKFLPFSAFAVEDQRKIYCLRYPSPVKSFVTVAA